MVRSPECGWMAQAGPGKLILEWHGRCLLRGKISPLGIYGHWEWTAGFGLAGYLQGQGHVLLNLAMWMEPDCHSGGSFYGLAGGRIGFELFGAAQQMQIDLAVHDSTKELILDLGYDSKMGARSLEHAVLAKMGRFILKFLTKTKQFIPGGARQWAISKNAPLI